MTSLVLVAIYLNIVPDRAGAVRSGRATIAEVVAATGSTMLSPGELPRLQALLAFVVERNHDIVSAGVRTSSNQLVVQVGQHAQRWTPLADDKSTESQILVPLWSGGHRWGQVELLFVGSTQPGWLGLLTSERGILIAFLAITGFIAFYLYLGRMLRNLDPSRAVPERVRAAFDTLAESLVVLDLRGYIVLANQAFAQLVDRPPEKLIGKAFTEFHWCDRDGRPITAEDMPWLRALQAGAQRRNQSAWLKDADGRQHSFMVNCSPILGGNQKYAGMLISLDDVTRLEEKENALRESQIAAELANRAKSEFLASMSHEIRTPMNAILGFAELLRRGHYHTEAELRSHLNTIHASGRHLIELINGVLDLSKVEAGKLEVESIECAPVGIVREVVQALNVRAMEKQVDILLEIRGLVPATIHSDPARLRQIVTNLIGNAIKFTERGRITVAMALQSGVEPRLTIAVTDTGIGIPTHKIDRIFDPFTQAEESTTRRFGGTGLGLTISRKIARALGGDIVVQSQPGEGSTFTISVPTGSLDGVTLIDGNSLRLEEPVRDNLRGQWKFPAAHVLVVDDGEENRELIRIALEDTALQVTGAANGQVALDLAAQQRFDLILMDMQMPVMDGFTATRNLRARGLTLPIVALTAHAMKGFERELQNVGCTAYLTKPIDLDALLDTMAPLLGATRSGGIVEPRLPQIPVSAPPPAETDDSPIASRLATHAKLQKVIGLFIDRLATQIEEMDYAHRRRDFEKLAELAHWLKGAGGSVGFDVFTTPAQKLEQAAKSADGDSAALILGELHALTKRLERPAAGETAQAATPQPRIATGV
jgi:PAS domain S-box-containing protein